MQRKEREEMRNLNSKPATGPVQYGPLGLLDLLRGKLTTVNGETTTHTVRDIKA